MDITGRKLFLKALSEENVDTIFAYPGGMVTDILDESTELLCVGNNAREYIIDAFDLNEDTDKVILKGVVSRKKQLIPTLVGTLQQ